MTWDEALSEVVRRTKHERYRWLCSDDNPDVESRDGYRAKVKRIAEGRSLELPDIDEHLKQAAALEDSPPVRPCAACP